MQNLIKIINELNSRQKKSTDIAEIKLEGSSITSLADLGEVLNYRTLRPQARNWPVIYHLLIWSLNHIRKKEYSSRILLGKNIYLHGAWICSLYFSGVPRLYRFNFIFCLCSFFQALSTKWVIDKRFLLCSLVFQLKCAWMINEFLKC